MNSGCNTASVRKFGIVRLGSVAVIGLSLFGVSRGESARVGGERGELFGALLQKVEERYLMPERFHSGRMFSAAVRAIEAEVPAFLASVEDGVMTIKAHGGKLEIPLRETRDLKGMDKWAFRTAAFVLQFAGDSISPLKLQQIMFGAMLETLDPHSGYFPPERFRGVQEHLLGEAAGIGVAIKAEKGYPVVSKVFPGSPALRVGIREGDVLLKIGGLELKDLPLTRVERGLRGEKGTRTELLVQRKGWTEPRTFKVVRAMIEIPSVEGSYLGAGIGLCRIFDFKVNTPEHLERDLKKLKKNGMRGLVLDLRNNQGGIVGGVTGAANLFVDEGLLLESVGRDGKTLKRWEADRKATVFNGPVLVLVGPDTVSAGEILAASLKGVGRAIVMGGRTWGKGTAQEIFHTSDGGGYRITTFQFQAAGGGRLHFTGVLPDIELRPVGSVEGGLTAFNKGVRDDEAGMWLPYGGGNSFRKIKDLTFRERHHVLRFLNKGDSDSVLELGVDFVGDLIGKEEGKGTERKQALDAWVERVRSEESVRIREFFSSVGVDWGLPEEKSRDDTFPIDPDEDGGVADFVTERDDLKLGFYADKDRAGAGEKVKLAFKISNMGTRTLYRCGGVLRSGRPWINGREFVVGNVPPGESRKAFVSMRVPFDVLSHYIRMETELIVNGRTTGVEVSRILEVVESRRPVFKYSVQLDDGKEGNGNGILEPGESGNLFVRIKNDGGTASDVRVDAIEASDPLLVVQPRVVLGEMVGDSSAGVVVPVRFSRRDHKGPVPNHGSVILVVYDRLLGSHVRAKVKIPALPSSFPCETFNGTAGVMGTAALRGAASDQASVVGRTLSGAVLNLEARCGSWFRARFGDGSHAFIHRDELTSIDKGERGAGNEYVPVFSVSPPEIQAVAAEKGKGDSFKVEGEVSHESGVKDVWVVTWSLDGDSRDTEKVFYRSAHRKSGRALPGGTFESLDETLSFSADVPVMSGSQFVGLVARNANDVKAVKSLSVFRETETVRHELEVGRTLSPRRLVERSLGGDRSKPTKRRRRGCGCIMSDSREMERVRVMQLLFFSALFLAVFLLFRGSGEDGES